VVSLNNNSNSSGDSRAAASQNCPYMLSIPRRSNERQHDVSYMPLRDGNSKSGNLKKSDSSCSDWGHFVTQDSVISLHQLANDSVPSFLPTSGPSQRLEFQADKMKKHENMSYVSQSSSSEGQIYNTVTRNGSNNS